MLSADIYIYLFKCVDLSVCVYIWVKRCVDLCLVHVRVCVQVHVHFAKTRARHRYLPLSLSTFFLWTGFYNEPGGRLATSKPQGHLSLSPTVLASRWPCPAFTHVPGIRTRVLMLARQVLLPAALSSQPRGSSVSCFSWCSWASSQEPEAKTSSQRALGKCLFMEASIRSLRGMTSTELKYPRLQMNRC